MEESLFLVSLLDLQQISQIYNMEAHVVDYVFGFSIFTQ